MKTFSKLVCFIGLIVSVTQSCSRKEYSCGHSIQQVPFRVAFKGYSSSDLSKVVISAYDTMYVNHVKTDTFDFSAATFKGDTAYVYPNAVNGNALYIGLRERYEIKILSRNQTHYITNIHNGIDFYSWTQKDFCSPGTRSMQNRPYLYDLNGQPMGEESWTAYLTAY